MLVRRCAVAFGRDDCGQSRVPEGLDEGRELIEQVLAAATKPELIYEHQWMDYDLVIWDNRSTLHRLRPYDIASRRRVMRRITVAGNEPVS